MLQFMLCVALVGALVPSSVFGLQTFVFNDAAGKPCIMAEFEAVFSGTYVLMNGTDAAFTYAMPPGVEVDKMNSTCANASDSSSKAVLALTFLDQDTFTMTFASETDTNKFYLYEASVGLVQSPAYFPDSKDPNKLVIYGGQPNSPAFETDLGKSFTCNSELTVGFPDNFAVDFTNLTVQPFELEDGKFSEVEHCDGDVVEPTGVAPARWAVLDADKQPCILADFGMTFAGTYMLMNKTEGMFHYEMPPNAEVDVTASKCGVVGGAHAVLVLMFDGANTFKQEFMADPATKMYKLVSAVASLNHDGAHFPDSNDTGTVVTYGGPAPKPLFETGLGSYYKCSAEDKLEYPTDKFSLAYTDVQIQPFNVTGNFGDMNQCAADTPVIVPSEPPVGNWTITDSKGKTCMKMSFSLNMIVTYDMINKTQAKAGFYLPVTKVQIGKSSCSNTSAVFSMEFTPPGSSPPANNWVIQMMFTMKSGGSNYAMTNFTVQYDEDQAHFPFIQETIPVTTVKLFNTTEDFGTSKGKYYMCKVDKSIDTHGFDAIFGMVKLQPFAGLVKDNGYGVAADCQADNNVNNIVPIAVGCALAGLVVIVLVAYLIGRSRSNKSGYQSV